MRFFLQKTTVTESNVRDEHNPDEDIPMMTVASKTSTSI